MKRAILFLLAICFVFAAFSQSEHQELQTLTNNKGIPILPAWGDYGLGIGADPFFTYFGNFFSGTDQNQLLFYEPFLNLKYFNSHNRAYRMRIGLNFNNHVSRNYVQDDYAFVQDPLSLQQTVDKRTFADNSFFIDLAIEFRRGKTRLQGFYGGGPYIGYESMQWQYNYGNPYSEINNSPSSYNYGQNILSYGRITQHDFGSVWQFGLSTFIGVEYFFLPKASLGTQANLLVFYALHGTEKREIELWENGNLITEMLSPGNRSFNAFTLHSYFNTFLMFHF